MICKQADIPEQSVCIFKNITDIPCPACGSTRATIQLINGHFMDVILLNPLALFTNIFILLAIVWMFYDIIRDRETFLPALKKMGADNQNNFIYSNCCQLDMEYSKRSVNNKAEDDSPAFCYFVVLVS